MLHEEKEDSDYSSDEDEVLKVLEDTDNQKKLRKQAATYEDLQESVLRSRRENAPSSWRELNKNQMIDFFLADDEEHWRNEDLSAKTLSRRKEPELLGNVADISEQELLDPFQIFGKMFSDTLANQIIDNKNRSYEKEAMYKLYFDGLQISPIQPTY
jgi:hypothetical protein